MKQPKISVIVPVYNVEKYLSRCIDSLLNQTLTDIEIIIVDDGSPDNCPAMCDEYAKQDNRIKVIHKKNGGLGFARNSGLEIATGKYVAFVDSDDFVDVTMYEKLLQHTEINALDTCYCRFQRYYSSGRTRKITECDENRIFDGRKEVDTFFMEMLGGDEYGCGRQKYEISVWKAIYSMDLIKQYNISFISEKELDSEDLFFHIDYLSRANKVGWLNESLYFYFYNTNSITTSYSEREYNLIKAAMRGLAKWLDKYYLFEFYKFYYHARLLVFQKQILIQEVARKDISYRAKRKILKNECREKLLIFLHKDYSIKKLPLRKKLHIIALRYKLVDLLILLIKLNEIRYKMRPYLPPKFSFQAK